MKAMEGVTMRFTCQSWILVVRYRTDTLVAVCQGYNEGEGLCALSTARKTLDFLSLHALFNQGLTLPSNFILALKYCPVVIKLHILT